jgi:hypothetical protein
MYIDLRFYKKPINEIKRGLNCDNININMNHSTSCVERLKSSSKSKITHRISKNVAHVAYVCFKLLSVLSTNRYGV